MVGTGAGTAGASGSLVLSTGAAEAAAGAVLVSTGAVQRGAGSTLSLAAGATADAASVGGALKLSAGDGGISPRRLAAAHARLFC